MTWRGRSRKTSSSSNSRRVRLMRRPPRNTSSDIRSTTRSPMRSTWSPLAAPPAQHRPDPGQQLLEGERPAQAVVGARLQPLDPLADPGRGGEQDDRGLVAGVAQPPADLQPFQARRAGVEQDAVDRGPAQQVEGALAVAGDGDPEALALEERTDTVVIVDDQERTRHLAPR